MEMKVYTIEQRMHPQYPNLVDIFPYSDIKNDISDISTEFHIDDRIFNKNTCTVESSSILIL